MTQMMAKVLSSVAINSILIVIIAIGALIIKVPVTLILLIFILAMLEIVMFAMIGLLIDLHSPKLVWDDEQKAVKQNFNSMKSLLIGLVVGGAGTAATIVIDANYIISYFALALVTLIADVILYKVLSTVGYKLFNKIAD
jgi:ABC-2 type transport system permease protein